MNYNYIEMLISKIKLNDQNSEEKLIEEFRPLTLSIAKKTFIHGYDNEDIINECYSTLFKCIKLYNPQSHRFVAYATNAIKNNINDLIRTTKRRSPTEGKEALVLSDNLEHVLHDSNNIEEVVLDNLDCNYLKSAIKQLNPDEFELIDFIYFKNNSLKLYSYWKNISYTNACHRKTALLNKLNKNLTPNVN